MRAGSLDRSITIQQSATVVDENGTPALTWTDFATARAQVVTATTNDFLKAYGETETMVAVFRIRWLAGVTTAMRVNYASENYQIVAVTEIGRRVGLELRCELVRAEVA